MEGYNSKNKSATSFITRGSFSILGKRPGLSVGKKITFWGKTYY
jgi:hypothetical protein